MKSMTAFTQGRHVDPGFSLSVSIRSSNHRQADWSIRGSGITPITERMVRQELGERVRRGRVEVVLDLFLNDSRHWEVQFNDYLAGEILRRLGPALRPHRDLIRIDADTLLRIPMLFHLDPLPEALGEDAQIRINGFFRTMLSQWDAQREEEGEGIAREISGLLERCRGTWASMTAQVEVWESGMQERSRKRVERLLGGRRYPDDDRIMNELVLLAEKSSSQEELRRLGICLDRLQGLLGESETPGREGDYLTQDLLRDLQVLGSRLFEPAALAGIGELRRDVEQIRQLLLNVE